MDKPLSNFDLDMYIKEADFDKTNIVETSKINHIPHIFNDRGHCILFHKFNKNDTIGHWIPLVRNDKNEAILMCSYGTQPEQIKGLKEALKREGIKKLYVNDKQYQEYDTNCCGKYSLFVIGCNKLGLNIQQMQQLLEAQKKKFGSFDNFILKLFDY